MEWLGWEMPAASMEVLGLREEGPFPLPHPLTTDLPLPLLKDKRGVLVREVFVREEPQSGVKVVLLALLDE